MSKRRPPGSVEQTELPIGFSLCYNHASKGVFGTGLRLSDEITLDPERVKEYLYERFESLCNSMDPTRVHRQRAYLEKRANERATTPVERAVRTGLTPQFTVESEPDKLLKENNACPPI